MLVFPLYRLLCSSIDSSFRLDVGCRSEIFPCFSLTDSYIPFQIFIFLFFFFSCLFLGSFFYLALFLYIYIYTLTFSSNSRFFSLLIPLALPLVLSPLLSISPFLIFTFLLNSFSILRSVFFFPAYFLYFLFSSPHSLWSPLSLLNIFTVSSYSLFSPSSLFTLSFLLNQFTPLLFLLSFLLTALLILLSLSLFSFYSLYSPFS